MNTQTSFSGVSKSARPGVVREPEAGNVRRHTPRFDFSYQVGSDLGRDLIVTGLLSAGPTTEIYRVWSKSCLCTMACKLLREAAAEDDRNVRALNLELRVLRRLNHPNIVRVYEPSRHVGTPHILMEYLDGPSLYDELSRAPRRRLRPDEAIRISVLVGAALASLHDAGYIYRDLKPANIIMRESRPVLIDFGAAYRWKPGRSPRLRLGTDPYMAPEQCLKRPLCPATDVYGLGAVTYEMLSGEWPHEEQLMNIFDRSRIHTRFPQVAYLPGSLRRKVTYVSSELEAVVTKCLARRRADRYRSMVEVVCELDALLPREESLLPEPIRRAGVEALTGNQAA